MINTVVKVVYFIANTSIVEELFEEALMVLRKTVKLLDLRVISQDTSTGGEIVYKHVDVFNCGLDSGWNVFREPTDNTGVDEIVPDEVKVLIDRTELDLVPDLHVLTVTKDVYIKLP